MIDKRQFLITETMLQVEAEKLARKFGIFCFHVPTSIRMAAGWPDEVFIGRGVLFREIKDAFRSPSPRQTEVGYRLVAAGADFRIWRPRDWLAGHIERELRTIAWHDPDEAAAAGPPASYES
jgi:hypothetical protein